MPRPTPHTVAQNSPASSLVVGTGGAASDPSVRCGSAMAATAVPHDGARTRSGGRAVLRIVAHGAVWFPPEAEPRIRDLMRLQCSATRSAYQAIHQHGLRNNAVRAYVKRNYMGHLNQRHISDACMVAAAIQEDHAIFGGRREWERLQNGTLSKQEWQDLRNSQLYSRGDRREKGNPNIRLRGDRLLVNDPSRRGAWIEGHIFMPPKWSPDLTCYDARLIRREGKFNLTVSWTVEAPLVVTDRARGVLGLDVNPALVALSDVSPGGDLLGHMLLPLQRLPFASRDKRDNDIRLLAKEVVARALDRGTPIAMEVLGFPNRARGSRKFQRMRSNFVFRRILNAIESRAARYGVEVIDVNPAFTSILGGLLYAGKLSLNGHAAAALVIGRRALGLRERQEFTVTPDASGSNRLNLEGRGRSLYLTRRAYSWLLERFLEPKPADLTGPGRRSGTCPKESRRGMDASPQANRAPEPVGHVDGGSLSLGGETTPSLAACDVR